MNEQKWTLRILILLVGILIALQFQKPRVVTPTPEKSEQELKEEIKHEIDSIIRNVDSVRTIDDALEILRTDRGHGLS